jgi:hypothetical protein
MTFCRQTKGPDTKHILSSREFVTLLICRNFLTAKLFVFSFRFFAQPIKSQPPTKAHPDFLLRGTGHGLVRGTDKKGWRPAQILQPKKATSCGTQSSH